MQCRLIGPEEKERFNAFLVRSPKGHVLQTWEWGELKGAGGWRPHRLLVEKEGQILAAVSLLQRGLPGGLSFFYAPRGPVLNMENAEVWDCLWRGIRDLGKKSRALFCKLDPDIEDGNELWAKRLQEAGAIPVRGREGFEGVQPRHVFRLDITPPEEQLLADFHQKTRYNLRLAEKKGVVAESGAGQEKLPEFYRLLKETTERDRFILRPYAYFRAFYDALVPAGLARLFMVYYREEAVAGALALRLGDKAWYIYGASSNSHRGVMPNYLMQWRMIQWAKAEGCALYDFRGVPGDVGEEHPLYGLIKFKRGFGGRYTRFIGEYDLVFRPAVYRLYRLAGPLYQSLARKVILLKRGRGKKGAPAAPASE
ncbi:MAG: peptidoglycan bridge formation glycyltransferase FemA/FemB family protein [Clostridiales bacterium]|nr:peptidoglycan bridge formation glycyltransferase FemA/FemB family protein [Clostridiales bacterium]